MSPEALLLSISDDPDDTVAVQSRVAPAFQRGRTREDRRCAPVGPQPHRIRPGPGNLGRGRGVEEAEVGAVDRDDAGPSQAPL